MHTAARCRLCTVLIAQWDLSEFVSAALHSWRACRGQDVRVHWWYRPDSYDEFVAASVAPLELDDDKPSSKGEAACASDPYSSTLYLCLPRETARARLQGHGSSTRGGWWTRTSTTSG